MDKTLKFLPQEHGNMMNFKIQAQTYTYSRNKCESKTSLMLIFWEDFVRFYLIISTV